MTFKTQLALSITASVFLLSACGGGDDMSIRPVEQSQILEQIRAFDAPEADLSTADKALEYMDLAEPGTFTWDKKSGSGGQVEFVNLILPDSGGQIDRLKLSGLHLQDGNPQFQVIEIEGLEYKDVLGEPFVTIEKGRLNVSQDLKDDILSNIGFMEVGDLFDDLDYLGWEPLASGGGYLQGFRLANRRLTLTSEFLGWAPEEEADHISLLVNNFSIKPDGRFADEDDLNISFDHVSLLGFDVFGTDSADYSDRNIYNVFDQGHKSAVIDNLEVALDSFFLKLPSLRSGLIGDPAGAFTNETDIPSLTMGFTDEPFSFELDNIYQLFQQAGLETAELSYRSKFLLNADTDTASAEYFDITVKDAFNVVADFEASGYQSFISTLIAFDKVVERGGSDIASRVTVFKDMQAQLDTATSGMDLGFVELSITDNNGLEKVFDAMAASQDVSVAVAKQQAKAYAMMMTLGIKDDFQSSVAEDFANSAQSFVTKGGQLKFSVRPDEGFNFGTALQDYQTYLKSDNSSQAREDGIREIDEDAPQSLRDIFGPMNIDFQHVE